MELDEWLESLRRYLRERTGRTDIEVTGGPYRGYDVEVNLAADGHPHVDFYSPIRLDQREAAALRYAVSMIRDWDATVAGRKKDERLCQVHFDKIKALFPSLELSFEVGDFESHSVYCRKQYGKISCSFDLWPNMHYGDIDRLANYIRKALEKVKDCGEGKDGCGAGANYWR